MYDQAARLRELAQEKIEPPRAVKTTTRFKTIVISSGKGGVGKSTVTLNLSFCLAKAGFRTILLDADMGMGNIDIMLGAVAKYNLYHVVHRFKGIDEIVLHVADGLDIIPGGSGISELADLGDAELDHLIQEFAKLDGQYDYMLIDTGAGISKQVMRFLLAADEIIVVTTPEPTSFTDAYGLIKSLHACRYDSKVHLIMNRVMNDAEGQIMADKFKRVSQKFLEREINCLGSIRRDSNVEDSIRNHQVIVEAIPNGPTAKSILAIAEKLTHSTSEQNAQPTVGGEGIRGFFKKLFGLRVN